MSISEFNDFSMNNWSKIQWFFHDFLIFTNFKNFSCNSMIFPWSWNRSEFQWFFKSCGNPAIRFHTRTNLGHSDAHMNYESPAQITCVCKNFFDMIGLEKDGHYFANIIFICILTEENIHISYWNFFEVYLKTSNWEVLNWWQAITRTDDEPVDINTFW